MADHYASNMIKLRDLAQARGSELLVVVQPEHGQLLAADARAARSRGELPIWPAKWYWSSFPTSYLMFRNRAVTTLGAAGVHTLDASSLIGDSAGSAKLFLDAVHLAPAGNTRVSRLISVEVRAILTAPSSASPS